MRQAANNAAPHSAGPCPETTDANSVPLSPETTALLVSEPFVAYRSLLIEWNQRFNLTAIREPAEIERVLFLDALRMLPAIDAYIEARDLTAARLVDIGSGGGLPGLPLKLARPELQVTLVEATQKKVTFLQHVIAELALDGAIAVHGRAEALDHDPAFRARYDIATARAVASLPALMELGIPFLRVKGRAFFPKSLEIGDELAAARVAAPLLGSHILSSERLGDSTTRLVVVEKTRPTPQRFPRRAGIPARDPLGRNRP